FSVSSWRGVITRSEPAACWNTKSLIQGSGGRLSLRLNSPFVKGLILGRFAGGLGQQPTGALAWRTDEYGVGAQILRGAAYVLGSRLGPASRRLLAMETGVLLAGKEV
ncbi:hypothetical protein PK34_21380, partial [Stutzerimonas stutzeri]